MPELFVGEVAKSARKLILPAFQEQLEFVAAQLGDDASVMGSAAWIAKTVSSNKPS
jgi:hypothetical protein